jgi:hypothetical protein
LVITIEVQGAARHGAVPRTQPLVSDTKVAAWVWKLGGTGPPGGPVGVVGVAVTPGEAVAVVDGDGGVAVVELEDGWDGCVVA